MEKLIEAILKIGAGGWPSWIVTGILLIIGIIFAIYSNKRKIEAAQEETEKNRQDEQAQGVTTGQTAETNLNQAEEKLDAHRSEGKKKRPLS